MARIHQAQQKNTEREQASQAQQQADKAPKQTIGIDQQKLNEAWNRYAAHLPQSEMYLRTIMERPPHIQDDTIVVDIINDTQKTICENADLLAYLRRELNNANVVLRPNLIVQEQQEVRPFTTREKLNSMLADNPHFQELIDRFGLDFV